MMANNKKIPSAFKIFTDQEKRLLSTLAGLAVGLILLYGLAALSGPFAPVVITAGGIILGGASFWAMAIAYQIGADGMKHFYGLFRAATYGQAEENESELSDEHRALLRAIALLSLGVLLFAVSALSIPFTPIMFFAGVTLIGGSSYEIMKSGFKLSFVKEDGFISKQAGAYVSPESQKIIASLLIVALALALFSLAPFVGPFGIVVGFMALTLLGGGGYGAFVHGFRLLSDKDANLSIHGSTTNSQAPKMSENEDNMPYDDFEPSPEEKMQTLVDSTSEIIKLMSNADLSKKEIEAHHESIQAHHEQFLKLPEGIRTTPIYQSHKKTMDSHIQTAESIIKAKYASETVKLRLKAEQDLESPQSDLKDMQTKISKDKEQDDDDGEKERLS